MNILEKSLVYGLFLCGFFSLNSCLYDKHVPCEQSECGCFFPDGWGIDLKFLKKVNFTVNSTDSDSSFLEYNLRLCQDIRVDLPNNSTNCSSTSLFTLKYKGSNVLECHTLGSFGNYSYVWDRKPDEPFIQYQHDNVTSKINLVCDQSSYLNKLTLDSHNDKSNVFTLTSRRACPDYKVEYGSNGTNIITVLLIIILVLFLVYMIGGMLVLKFIRGAEGVEIIPNHEFWLSIPTKMKNGLLFCIAGCKEPPTYDRI